MNTLISKPIDRKTYIIGFIIVYVLALIISNLTTTVGPNGAPVVRFFLPVSLFFGLVKLILAYKRIKDISSSKLYLLLLIIPLVVLLSSFINPAAIAQVSSFPFNNQGGGSFALFGIFVIFSLINLALTLFLMIKKGKEAPILPQVETKV